MKIAITGATGFLGRYILRELSSADSAGSAYTLRAWYRTTSDRSGIDRPIEWVPGELGDRASGEALLAGCDAIVHSALERSGAGFIESGSNLADFVRRNVIGTLELIEATRRLDVRRFVFVSTCAVHDIIMNDRPLDEAHPLWMKSHYGAHKAAIEKFVHSFGFGQGYEICAIRPTGIYGAAHPPEKSKWFNLVQSVKAGKDVVGSRGGKEVHAGDVARAIRLLIEAPADAIRGMAFNCYDRYVSQHDVAEIAKRLSGSRSLITGTVPQPAHQIDTSRLRSLGMTFGGMKLLEQTIAELLETGCADRV